MPLFTKRVAYIGLMVILVSCSFIISPTNAFADYLGTIISYNCDKAKDQVIIEYKGGVNEAFDKLMDNKGPNAWYPWDLVTVDKKQKHIVKAKKIFKTCKLSDGEYKITIGPEPGNWNVQGQLGARMSAWARISKNGKEVINRTMEDVWHPEVPIVSRITLKAKEPRPVIIEVKEDDFYK